MKEICLINNGENVHKVSYNLGIDILNKELHEGRGIINSKYVTTREGTEDVIVVKNYNPYFVRKLTSNESVLDVYALGYDVIGNHNEYTENTIVFHKLSGVKYSVGPLEKIADIAEKFGVSEQDIINNNNLNTTKLFVGQILII